MMTSAHTDAFHRTDTSHAVAHAAEALQCVGSFTSEGTVVAHRFLPWLLV
jgi:hypothetical protein